MEDKYTFGKCKNCGEHRALKNEHCKFCSDLDLNFDKIWEKIFGGK